MTKDLALQHYELFTKIRIISNKYRFRILELTQNEQINISELSKILNLSYTKCADYVRLLENANLVEKTKRNKEMLVKSKVNLSAQELKLKE